MALSKNNAKLLTTETKTKAQWAEASPRWLLSVLPSVELEAGTYRVNTVTSTPVLMSEHEPGTELQADFTDYHHDPLELELSAIQAVVKIHTQVLDVYNAPFNQLGEQLRLAIEKVKEEEEYRFINSDTYGLKAQCDDTMKFEAEAPTPDSMDDLLHRVWKKPAYFLMSPGAIARFGKECTNEGVCLGTVGMMGSPFMTWRGVPIIPSDKIIPNENGQSDVYLMRLGEENQGVVGLRQSAEDGIEGELGISVRFKYTDKESVSHYLVTKYSSLAVLVPDALSMMTVNV
jgi:hypothetical protein